MSTKVYNGFDMVTTRIENLGAPVAANDAARLADVQSAVEGLAYKDDARVATQANLNLASPGAVIDTVTMVVGNRVVVKAQTLPAENGIYIYNGAATPMTRALDANTSLELEAATLPVTEGSSAGTSWRQSSVGFILGTGAVNFAPFATGVGAASESSSGIATIATQTETDAGTNDGKFLTPFKLNNWSGRIKKAQQNIGDGSATQFDVTHNFNTNDVQVSIFRNAAPFDNVMVDISRPDLNKVRINFAAPPTVGQFRVLIYT